MMMILFSGKEKTFIGLIFVVKNISFLNKKRKVKKKSLNLSKLCSEKKQFFSRIRRKYPYLLIHDYAIGDYAIGDYAEL